MTNYEAIIRMSPAWMESFLDQVYQNERENLGIQFRG